MSRDECDYGKQDWFSWWLTNFKNSTPRVIIGDQIRPLPVPQQKYDNHCTSHQIPAPLENIVVSTIQIV